MDDTNPDAELPDEELDPLTDLVHSLRAEEYAVERPHERVLAVSGRFSNPERIGLQAAAHVGDEPVGIWAVNHHDDWVLVAWRRPDLVTIVQRGTAPQRWRHRRIPDRMRPDAQTFLEGAASAFDIVTRPKHQPTEAARKVLAGFGIESPTPPGWKPPAVAAPVVPRRVDLPSGAARPKRAATAKPAKPRATAKPEPTVAVCPTCFMALPATGICDNCG